MRSFFYFASLFGFFSFLEAGVSPPVNPPTWPANVFAYTTATPTSTIQTNINTAYDTNGNGFTTPSGTTVNPQTGWNDNGQFVNEGYAFLFAPGTYSGLNVLVGYYTSIMGLGENPTDTVINNVSCYMGSNQTEDSVCPDGDQGNLVVGALNTFWRSAENFSTNADLNTWFPTSCPGMTWAVSQACPMRKVVVNGALYLFQLTSDFSSGFASGGFMAD